MENDDGQFVYTIHGVKVSFPCKAYPTQLSMMNMIIKGIERHQNSLLESPTGSGKSLALLCSCLAWQSAEYEKKAKIEEQMKAEIGNDECCIKTCSDEQKQLPIDPANIIKSDYFQQNNSSLHVKISPETPLKTEAAVTLKKMPEQSESLPGKDVKSGSPTDDDFQPAKKH